MAAFDMLTGMRSFRAGIFAAFYLAATGVACAQQSAVSIEVPAGARAVLQAKGDGVQIYACTAATPGFQWKLQGPDAKLLDSAGRQVGTHFAGPTWKLNDSSQVQGELMASRPAPEASDAAWLLLRAKAGSATGKLADVAYIRRTDTHGGVPDRNACQSAGDAGTTTRVPYTATYTFYAAQ
jgi:hypothetical protein